MNSINQIIRDYIYETSIKTKLKKNEKILMIESSSIMRGKFWRDAILCITNERIIIEPRMARNFMISYKDIERYGSTNWAGTNKNPILLIKTTDSKEYRLYVEAQKISGIIKQLSMLLPGELNFSRLECCPKCGTLTKNINFCSQCGTRLSVDVDANKGCDEI